MRIGDVVQRKSDGISMTVVDFRSSTVIQCAWFDEDNHSHHQISHIGALVHISDWLNPDEFDNCRELDNFLPIQNSRGLFHVIHDKEEMFEIELMEYFRKHRLFSIIFHGEPNIDPIKLLRSLTDFKLHGSWGSFDTRVGDMWGFVFDDHRDAVLFKLLLEPSL